MPFTLLSILLGLAAAAAGYAVGVARSRSAVIAATAAARQEGVAARAEAAEARQTAAAAQAEAAAATARLAAERQHAAEAAEAQAQALRTEFRAVAADLARTEGQTLRTEHLRSLESLLSPLGRDIATFREQFIKGHADMGRHIKDLVEQTSAMGREAEDLARALRGNTKLQGNWGEAVLGNLLDAAGLTAGRDYTIQARTHDDEGRNLIPDVVVHLPGSRSVIIDSKVSLTAFTDYVAADGDAETQARLLKEHVASVRRHITELSRKSYDKVVKDSIGYVLMFIPGEAAYVAAVSAAPELATEAYARRVILINPTNLLMALQLTYNLWQSELQSRSVSEIYASAERLYKKFCGFAKNFSQIGQGIGQLSAAYERAEKQLTTGRGNIVSQLEGWKKKGLTPATDIPAALKREDGAADGDEGETEAGDPQQNAPEPA